MGILYPTLRAQVDFPDVADYVSTVHGLLAANPMTRRKAVTGHVFDTAEIEEEDEDEGDEGSDEGRDAPWGSRCCSYESITAAEGLAAWGFEELRVECYAQSLVARGTKPPPVVQRSLAIPPAFVPRIVPRS